MMLSPRTTRVCKIAWGLGYTHARPHVGYANVRATATTGKFLQKFGFSVGSPARHDSDRDALTVQPAIGAPECMPSRQHAHMHQRNFAPAALPDLGRNEGAIAGLPTRAAPVAIVGQPPVQGSRSQDAIREKRGRAQVHLRFRNDDALLDRGELSISPAMPPQGVRGTKLTRLAAQLEHHASRFAEYSRPVRQQTNAVFGIRKVVFEFGAAFAGCRATHRRVP
jgi:hypothetical protein